MISGPQAFIGAYFFTASWLLLLAARHKFLAAGQPARPGAVEQVAPGIRPARTDAANFSAVATTAARRCLPGLNEQPSRSTFAERCEWYSIQLPARGRRSFFPFLMAWRERANVRGGRLGCLLLVNQQVRRVF